jgi:hypothetical protein
MHSATRRINFFLLNWRLLARGNWGNYRSSAWVEACPTKAITQTINHHMAVRRREVLLLGKPGEEELRQTPARTRICENFLAGRYSCGG